MRAELPRPEKGPAGRVLRFFEMDAKEEGLLKERIAKFDGLVRVFVHPDFSTYANFESNADDPATVQKLETAETVFQRLLASESEKMPALIIFEDGANQEEFRSKEDAFREVVGSDVYVIRTEMANPTPLSPDRESTYKWKFLEPNTIPAQERTDMWQWILEEFKRLGIKKVLIGGLEYYVGTEPGGCLGMVLGELRKRSFDVEASLLTWPDKLREERT